MSEFREKEDKTEENWVELGTGQNLGKISGFKENEENTAKKLSGFREN